MTAGRVNTLSLDAINSYDPMGGSYAFSPLGFTGSFAGFGDTEAARANTAVKYRLDVPNFGIPLASSFRVGGLWQWGGYDQGNGTNGLYQGQVGGDFNLFGGAPFAGVLSLDAIGSYAKDAVNLGTFTGTCATLTKGPFAGQTGCTTGLPIAPGFTSSFYSNTDLKATLSNNTGVLLTAKYKWQAWTLYGGYGWLRQGDTSDRYPDGFRTIGGWNVPATVPSTFPGASKFWPTQWISYTTYAVPRIAPYFWLGAKYAINPQLDVTGAFYYLQQSDYNTAACTGVLAAFVQPNGNKLTVARSSSGSCAGTEDFFSVARRLSAVQARRPLRWPFCRQPLRRSRERLSGDPEHFADSRPAHQVLTRRRWRPIEGGMGRLAPRGAPVGLSLDRLSPSFAKPRQEQKVVAIAGGR